MDNRVSNKNDKLTMTVLIELIKMYSRNWMTVDGLWFSGVEEKYGLEAAMELDVRMWKIGSLIEAKRIKKLLNLHEGGLEAIVKTVDFMTWAASFGYEWDILDNRAIWTCTRCVPQEQRSKMGKEEFPCKPTFDAMFNNVTKVIEPRAQVKCVFCPPGPRPEGAWCQWEVSLSRNEETNKTS